MHKMFSLVPASSNYLSYSSQNMTLLIFPFFTSMILHVDQTIPEYD